MSNFTRKPGKNLTRKQKFNPSALHRANADRLKIAIADSLSAQDIDRANKLKILLQVALKLADKYEAPALQMAVSA